MGQFGRLTSLDDLPPRATLDRADRKAMELIDEGVKPVARQAREGALHRAAGPARRDRRRCPPRPATFDGFPPCCQREYVEWVTEAKRDETRAKRLAQTVEWLAEGKRRNWKYENC